MKPGAVVTVETHDAFEGKITDGERQAVGDPQLPLPQPAERADRRRGRREGRLPRRPYPLDQAARAAAGRHHLPDPRVRRPRRHRPHRDAQRAAAGEGEEAQRRRERRLLVATRSRCRTSPSSARSARRPEIEAISSLQPDYYGGNMDLPDVGAGVDHLPAGEHQGRAPLSRRLPRGAGRRRALRRRARDAGDRRRSRSTSSRARPSPGRGSRPTDFMMTIGSARPMEDAARIAYRELVRWVAPDSAVERGRGLPAADACAARCGSATWSTRSTRSALRSPRSTSADPGRGRGVSRASRLRSDDPGGERPGRGTDEGRRPPGSRALTAMNDRLPHLT